MRGLNRFWSNANVLGQLVEPQSVQSLCIRRLRGYLLAPFRPLLHRPAALAGALLMGLALVMGSGLWLRDITHSNGVYLTAIGQQSEVTLVDGSRLQLNTNSQVEVEFSEGYRNISCCRVRSTLKYLSITRPFRVYAGNGRVQAVGTAFNVYLQDEDVNVIVTEGRVALASLSGASFREVPKTSDKSSLIRKFFRS